MEEIMPLNLIYSNIQEDDQIGKYFNSQNKIKAINRIDQSDHVQLDVTNRFEYNEVIQLLIPNNALESFENISSQLIFNDQLNIEQIQNFFLNNCNFDSSEEDISDNDYISWSLSSDYLIEKAKEFRLKIDLYKAYDNQNHLVTKLLIEIIEYYVNEYLFKEEHFSKEDTLNIEQHFQKAIEEQNYLKHFIKAYTLTNKFHHLLNKHLALYLLEYFNTSNYSLLKTKYRLINCLAYIVTLLIHHPDINQYQFNGITYRGLLMKPNHLKCYSIGNCILNKSFVSTSKNRSIAELFADNRQSDDENLIEIPVLLKYTIKQNQTAIDIQQLSVIPAEEEVLILPFSVFQIKNRITKSSSRFSSMFVEIDLEECQQIDYEKHINKSITNLQDQTKKRNFFIKSTIVLCIMISLIVALGFIIKNKINSNNQSWNQEKEKYTGKIAPSSININTTWKQDGIIIAGGNGNGSQLNQLSDPEGIYVDDKNQAIYIADSGNHRIVEWKLNAKRGPVVAGGNTKENQLNYPTDVIVDEKNNSLIICDKDNNRVIRWSRQNPTNGETIISDIDCHSLSMDDNGNLYVSDWMKNEVRRWKIGDKNGIIVAGGNGQGYNFNQLYWPTYLFVDENHSIYVSDLKNHRVMKWMKGAKYGIIIAGGNGEGNSLSQLSYPHGVFVDQSENVYVADCGNARIMRWSKRSNKGLIVIGGNGNGSLLNQLYCPTGLSFDEQGNLYVVDSYNYRVQKFFTD